MDVATAFRLQAAGCERMGSPLYARLLEIAVADLEREGPIHGVVDHWDQNPMDDAVALRLLGGVHRLALSGRAPALASHYPSTGGSPRWPDCGDDFLDTVAAHVPELRIGMLDPPQTNEVGRAGVLIGGLLEISRLTAMPIRLLEIGTSAGLNLRLDDYRYRLGQTGWGSVSSPVVVRTEWRGSPPEADTPIEIAERRGCDAAPIHVADPIQALRLVSFVWPDHMERFERTQRAIAHVKASPVPIDAASADEWLARHLDEPRDGMVTVVMHSAVMQYLGKELRARVGEVLRTASRHATANAPLARLSLEPGQRYFALRLRMWPSGIDVLLADAHPHGAWANWFVGTMPR